MREKDRRTPECKAADEMMAAMSLARQVEILKFLRRMTHVRERTESPTTNEMMVD